MLPVDGIAQQREARAADAHVVARQVEADQLLVGAHRRGVLGLQLERHRAAHHRDEVAHGGLLGHARARHSERLLTRRRYDSRRAHRLPERALELAVGGVEEHADDAAGAVGCTEGEVQCAQHRVGEVAERALGAGKVFGHREELRVER